MGLFSFLKKDSKEEKKEELFAPITGKYIPLEQINDAVFSQGILGEGCGIIPSEGCVYAPADGKVTFVADTKHAVGFQTSKNVELLIHVGMDTVEMHGDGFDVKVTAGTDVKKGDLLLCFDIQKIVDANHPIDTAFIVAEKGGFEKLLLTVEQDYKAGDSIGHLSE